MQFYINGKEIHKLETYDNSMLEYAVHFRLPKEDILKYLAFYSRNPDVLERQVLELLKASYEKNNTLDEN